MSQRVGYIVSRFPKLSETFILDEILGLESRGLEIQVFSFLREREATTHPEAAKLVGRSRFLAEMSRQWLPAQLHWLSRRPGAWLGVWSRVLLRHAASPRRLARALVAVAHAMVLARWLAREPVAHLHAHWATHTALTAWAVHRLTGTSYSFTTHADDLYLHPAMLAEKVREAAFVVTISEYNRSFLTERLGDWARAKIHVIHCGVSTVAFAPAPPPAASEPFVIACVARLEPKKGHRFLLEACAELRRRGVELRCLLVGEGAERSALEAHAATLGLRDSLELLGTQPRDRVREILASAHVVVLPSVVLASGRADGIPVALMEALAMQRPVVATAVTGVPELVESELTGLLVEPEEAGALADALERLWSDPELAARLALAGRRRVEEQFDIDRNVERLCGLFETHGGSESVASCQPVGAFAR
jgi:glycosyltransferase involved in cell wall biosynthesis